MGRRKSDPRLLTTGQVAKICRLSINKIIECIKKGFLESSRVPNSNHRRIAPEELERFMIAFGLPLEWLPKP